MMVNRIHRNSEGYILVTTVFVLAIVGFLFAGIAGLSIDLATEAQLARSDLQSKWATASCQRFALSRAPEILGLEGENETGAAKNVVAATCVLNKQTVEIVISDESSKVDVNLLFEYQSRVKARQSILQIVGPSEMFVRLHPLPESVRDVKNDAFEGWGQVFSSPKPLDNPAKTIIPMTRGLTCWGRKLNYKSASEKSIAHVAKIVVGAITGQRFAKAITGDRNRSLDDLLAEIEATNDQSRAIKSVFTGHSHSQAVWVSVANSRRTPTMLAIREQYTAGIFRIHSFSW